MTKKLRASSKGLIIYYYGNGKGKTTAAVGVAVRAVGWGWNVLFMQFFKSETWPSGERKSLKKLGIDVKVLGEGFVGILGDKKPRHQHVLAAQRALKVAKQVVSSGKYQLVILDEIISCLEVGLLHEEDVVRLLKQKANETHVVLTGHKKYAKIASLADTVTEMRKVKHPYYKGFLAQKGIDF